MRLLHIKKNDIHRAKRGMECCRGRWEDFPRKVLLIVLQSFGQEWPAFTQTAGMKRKLSQFAIQSPFLTPCGTFISDAASATPSFVMYRNLVGLGDRAKLCV